MDDYISRLIDAEVSDGLDSSGAVVIRGARAVGKTESARQFAASELRLDSADPRVMLAREQPATALSGDTPRLLDEWQLIPELWNEVRHEVDDRRTTGQFILSGSASPDDDALRHSGAGRFTQINMRTLSFLESTDSTGAVSLAQLLDSMPTELTESPSEFIDVIRRIVSGGWPGWIHAQESRATSRASSYIDDISEHDFPQIAGSRRDPRRLRAYLRAVADVSAQPATYAAMARRMQEQSNLSVSQSTVPMLHDLSHRLFLIEDQPAWSPKLRSRTAQLQTPKRHLADPSLACVLLDSGIERLLLEPETLGFLFESQVVHDLRVYAQSIRARGVFHYRDSKGRDEIDVIVEGQNGDWVAFEVKLGTQAVETAAENLIRVASKIERPPKAMVVVVPAGIAHVRRDGVHVVPISTLGP